MRITIRHGFTPAIRATRVPAGPSGASARSRIPSAPAEAHRPPTSKRRGAASPPIPPLRKEVAACRPPSRAGRRLRHSSAPPATARARHAEVIAFANQKGGVAKTTTTLNLAVAFAETGHRVLAVDMDPQGNLTMSQGIDPDSVDKSMYDVLVHGIPIREVDPQARGGRRLRLDRPGRRRDRDEHQDRPRAVAREGAQGRPRRLRLRVHRHAAVARPADDQRADSRRQSYRPGSV